MPALAACISCSLSALCSDEQFRSSGMISSAETLPLKLAFKVLISSGSSEPSKKISSSGSPPELLSGRGWTDVKCFNVSGIRRAEFLSAELCLSVASQPPRIDITLIGVQRSELRAKGNNIDVDCFESGAAHAIILKSKLSSLIFIAKFRVQSSSSINFVYQHSLFAAPCRKITMPVM